MVQVKKINTKNRSYYFCDDMINIKNLIFTILVTLRSKKFDDYENIHDVNPLYLIIHSASGHF